uniref:Mutator-like transposase n=1 Tax=Solanum tuberosum TaxID=4113 RepID=M1DY04_SOLTU
MAVVEFVVAGGDYMGVWEETLKSWNWKSFSKMTVPILLHRNGSYDDMIASIIEADIGGIDGSRPTLRINVNVRPPIEPTNSFNDDNDSIGNERLGDHAKESLGDHSNESLGICVNGIVNVYNHVHHGYCMRQLGENLRVNDHCGDYLYLKYNAAKAYSLEEFNNHFVEFKNKFPTTVVVLEYDIDFEKWRREHFPSNRYDVMTTNIIELLNAMFIDKREYLVASIINLIAKRFGELFRERTIRRSADCSFHRLFYPSPSGLRVLEQRTECIPSAKRQVCLAIRKLPLLHSFQAFCSFLRLSVHASTKTSNT